MHLQILNSIVVFLLKFITLSCANCELSCAKLIQLSKISKFCKFVSLFFVSFSVVRIFLKAMFNEKLASMCNFDCNFTLINL